MLYFDEEEFKKIKLLDTPEALKIIYKKFEDCGGFDPDEVIDSLVNIETAKKEFTSLLHYTPKRIKYVDKIYNYKYDSEYKYNFNNLCIVESNFKNASNFFNAKQRWKAVKKVKSPWEILLDLKYFKNILRQNYIYCKEKFNKLDSNFIAESIRFNARFCSQFEPAVAKSVYTYFKSKNILDLSSGWGDRMCGFYATYPAKLYVGIDPNYTLTEGYNNQMETYQTILDSEDLSENKKTAKIICDGSENVDYKKLGYEFDTIFTSPPYFNCEKYLNDDKQSYVRFNSKDAWLKNYLKPTLEKSWEVLKEGGYLILNISDNTTIRVCNEMNDIISKLENAKYKGTINMRVITSRFVGNIIEETGNKMLRVEPMWVWQKSKEDIPLNIPFDYCPYESIIFDLEDW